MGHYYICTICKTWIKCVANGQRLEIPTGSIYAADKYECDCGANSFYIMSDQPLVESHRREEFTGEIDDCIDI
jgi:hypothetical protein